MDALKSLGILGGTFDPIHYGHLIAAECVRNQLKLDQVLFIPSARPPHKELSNVSNCMDRYNMVKDAIDDNPFFEVSSLEMARKGFSYTIDTIDYYLNKFKGVEIFFILGIDALLLIDTWKDVNHLVTMCKFAAVTRPGYNIDKKDKRFNTLPEVFWENLRLIEIPGIDISSSDIRQRVRTGKSIKYLVPPTVEKYILDRGLYANKECNFNDR